MTTNIISTDANKQLESVIKSIDMMMYEMDSIKEAISEAAKSLKDVVDISPADIKKIASIVHKNNVEEEREKTELIFDIAEKYLGKNTYQVEDEPECEPEESEASVVQSTLFQD